MGRSDKSARIAKAIAAFKSGEIKDYTTAAKVYNVDRTTISKRICGLTRLGRRQTLFFASVSLIPKKLLLLRISISLPIGECHLLVILLGT